MICEAGYLLHPALNAAMSLMNIFPLASLFFFGMASSFRILFVVAAAVVGLLVMALVLLSRGCFFLFDASKPLAERLNIDGADNVFLGSTVLPIICTLDL